MRRFLLVAMSVVLVMAGRAAADEAAVKKMIGDYANAFNAKQLDGVMAFWTENGVHVDRDTGERTEGREAIRADIATAFQERPNHRIMGRIERVHFVKPDIASVDGSVVVTSPDGEPVESMFSAILVDQNGKWMIDTIEEVAVAAPADVTDALAELEWLVGHWVDESSDASVDTFVRWSPNRSFLIRSYSVTDPEGNVGEGTQVIGWDPRSNEIRSWAFNSDGSFGDATWSKSGEDWLIKSTQTLPDGQAASGTYVLSRVGEDEISMKLIGHEIEGQPQPTRPAVSAVRVADDPVAQSE